MERPEQAEDIFETSHNLFRNKFFDVVMSILGIIQGLALGKLAGQIFDNADVINDADPSRAIQIILCYCVAFLIIVRIFQTYLLAALEYTEWSAAARDLLSIFLIGIVQYWMLSGFPRSPGDSFSHLLLRYVTIAVLSVALHTIALRSLQSGKEFSDRPAKRDLEIRIQKYNIFFSSAAMVLFAISLAGSHFVLVSLIAEISACLVIMLNISNSISMTFTGRTVLKAPSLGSDRFTRRLRWAMGPRRRTVAGGRAVTRSSAGSKLRIHTATVTGQRILVREMRLSDAWPLYRCLMDPAFEMPVLTGNRNRALWPLQGLMRSVLYVCTAGMLSRVLAPYLFGARRHWVMTVVDVDSRSFVGVVMLDAVIRFDPLTDPSADSPYIAAYKKARGGRVGDGEIGFFTAPAFRRRRITVQALYALIAALTHVACGYERPVLTRVWACTGASNLAARSLIEELGLELDPVASAAIPGQERFHADGKPIHLCIYEQGDGESDGPHASPAEALLGRAQSRDLVNPFWAFGA